MGSQETVAITQIETQRTGYLAVSFDGIRSASAIGVAVGSKVEVGGSLFYVTATEEPSGFSAITTARTCFVYAVVAGSGSTASIHFDYSETEPTWSDAYQGFYNSADRAVGQCFKAGTTIQRGVKSYSYLNYESARDIFNGGVSAASNSTAVFFGNNGLIVSDFPGDGPDVRDASTYEDFLCGLNVQGGGGATTHKYLVAGTGGAIYKSADGRTWTAVSTSVTSDIVRAAHPTTDETGSTRIHLYARNGQLLYSSDSGSSFTVQTI